MSLELLRQRLARADALLPLALIGIASGFATGIVIICFRLITESSVSALTPNGHPEGFESLHWSARLALPIFGGFLIGVVFQRCSVGSRQVGVVHVMDQLAYAAGRLPWRNAVMQFVGGATSIISGHSMGREGPVIHVGAACSSLLGQWMALPNNSLRVLVACGTAASIGASFNTPIAGVIFAMEVVMMEYTLVGFTPVILAAVVATSLSHIVYGADTAFDMQTVQMASLWELPYVLLVGVVIGSIAALFIDAIFKLDKKLRHIDLWKRTTMAGAITGLCALVRPEVMGIGYDTVEQALGGALVLHVLIFIGALKLVATVACVSLGLPGGLIGPTLVIGACVGGAMGIAGEYALPHAGADASLYALLGMGAMMGATLQAPLAALMAVLELTGNPNSILPGMVAIVTATMMCKVTFGKDSVFVMMLRSRGKDYQHDPVAVALTRTGVSAVMNRHVSTIDAAAPLQSLHDLLTTAPKWVALVERHQVRALVEDDTLTGALEADTDGVNTAADVEVFSEAFATVMPQATLREALDKMEHGNCDLALVTRRLSATADGILGVLTREQIEASVRYQR